MKRVIIFVNGTDVNGKVFVVTHSLEELLKAASAKFEITAKKIFTSQGGEIDDIKLVRDDDILYISNGENFIHTNKNLSYTPLSKNSEWITLNVGGKYFTTTRDTLTKKEPMSMLARKYLRREDPTFDITHFAKLEICCSISFALLRNIITVANVR